MTKSDWMDLAVLERKKYGHLSEVMDLSKQIGEALDRNDQVSLRMLLSLRQEPILHLEELKRVITIHLEALPAEDRERVAALGNGAAPRGAEETAYANQAGSVRRLLERVLELDQRLNRRLTGEKSVYAGGGGKSRPEIASQKGRTNN